MLSTNDLVMISGDLFYHVAVPLTNDAVEEDPNLYKGLIYNSFSKGVKFVDLGNIRPADGPLLQEQAVESSKLAAFNFLSNPLYCEFVPKSAVQSTPVKTLTTPPKTSSKKGPRIRKRAQALCFQSVESPLKMLRKGVSLTSKSAKSKRSLASNVGAERNAQPPAKKNIHQKTKRSAVIKTQTPQTCKCFKVAKRICPALSCQYSC